MIHEGTAQSTAEHGERLVGFHKLNGGEETMICHTTVQMKHMTKLVLLLGCLAILLAGAFALATTTSAQEPEEKGPMVSTTEFPEVGELSEPATDVQPDQYCYDQYEPDDSMWQASRLYPAYSQYHAFCRAWDRDFMRFSARTAMPYVIETSNLGWNTDTVLELYDSWGRLITQDDDGGVGYASRIAWTAPYNGTFYVHARQYDAYRAGSGAYYNIQLDEYSMRCQAIGCNNRVWVDRGCGAYYGIGRPVRVYMSVEVGGYYRLGVSTNWGSRTIWSGYLGRGTYYLNGSVGSPTGAHRLTLYDGFMNPSCTFYATYGANDYPAIETLGDTPAESATDRLPDAQPLDIKDGEW